MNRPAGSGSPEFAPSVENSTQSVRAFKFAQALFPAIVSDRSSGHRNFRVVGQSGSGEDDESARPNRWPGLVTSSTSMGRNFDLDRALMRLGADGPS